MNSGVPLCKGCLAEGVKRWVDNRWESCRRHRQQICRGCAKRISTNAQNRGIFCSACKSARVIRARNAGLVYH